MHRLRPHLHIALSNGRPVFLDVAADRYFCLAPILERAFLDWLENPASTAIPTLIDAGLLVAGDTISSQPPLAAATRSLIETAMPLTASGIGRTLIFRSVVRRRLEQRFTPLAVQFDRITSRRHAASEVQPLRAPRPTPGAILASFRRHRRLVPIATCCLLDSLALLDLLARFDHHPQLVIGVTLDPFLAHCWLQDGDTALNEHVGHVAGFSPILVI